VAAGNLAGFLAIVLLRLAVDRVSCAPGGESSLDVLFTPVLKTITVAATSGLKLKFSNLGGVGGGSLLALSVRSRVMRPA